MMQQNGLFESIQALDSQMENLNTALSHINHNLGQSGAYYDKEKLSGYKTRKNGKLADPTNNTNSNLNNTDNHPDNSIEEQSCETDTDNEITNAKENS